jgi:exopolysaccharide production protein ExoQ
MRQPLWAVEVRSNRRAALQATLASLLRGAERLFAVAALLVFAGGFTAVLRYVGLADETGLGAPRQILLPPVYLISAGILLLRPAGLLQAAARNKPILVLTALALVSWVWSEAPMLTLKRGAMLIGSTLFGLYLVTRFHQRELLRLLGWALGIIAVLSVAFVLLFPDRGIAAGLHQGAWTGIYGEKNGFGRYMALGTLVFIALAMQGKRSWPAWLGAGLCALLVVLSRSTTALVALVCALGMVAVVPILRQRGLLLVSLGILALVFIVNSAVLTIWNLDAATAALGKNATLSGRVPLWSALIENIREKPVLGSGYNAFWIGESGAPSALQFEVTGGWDVWHAHNGFLDLALELGLLGVLVFLIGYLVAFGRAVRTLRSSTFGAGFWSVAFLVFLLATSVSESTLLRYNSLWWVVYLVTVFAPIPSTSMAHQRSGEAAARGIRPVAVPTHASRPIHRTRFRALPSIKWRTWR